MPTITLDIPTAAAQRISNVLDHEGFTGTPAEKIAEVKRRLVDHLRAWVVGAEIDIAEKAAQDAATGLDVT